MLEQGTWEEAVRTLLQDPEQSELVEACYYDEPLAACAQRFYESDEWSYTRCYLPPLSQGNNALDIGAGRGIASYALVKDGWHVSALEPDESELVGAGAIRKLASENDLDITVITSKGESLPFEEGTFDLVYVRQVLHHADHLERFCQEISRVLKQGGTFIAVREHVLSRQKDLDVFLKRHPLHHLYGGEHAYKLCEYTRAIKQSGIKMQKILPPYSNPINLFPLSAKEIQKKLKTTLRMTVPLCAIRFGLRVLDVISRQPGRLYSFIGIKL